MECPYCKQEMVLGYIQSPRQKIFWGVEKHKFFLMPSGDDISLTEGWFTNPAVEAYCCEHCRKIIMDY